MGKTAQSVENLRAYCELLRTTNPALEAGAADLGRLGHSVHDTTTRLSDELDHLATDLDGLQKEAESSETSAVKACQELGHAAEEANHGGMAEIEKDAAAAQEHWTTALHETTAALDAAFQELASSGFEPLDSALDAEQKDFEKWTHDADETLNGLVQAVHSVEAAVAHQGTVLDEAARDLEGAPPFQNYWGGVNMHALTVNQESVPHFSKAVTQHGEALNAVHEQLAGSAGEGSTHVRGQLDLTAQMAVTAIDAKDTELTQVVEAATEAVKTAQIEFERGAIQAEDAEKEGHDVAELAGHVAEAEVQLHQVQATLEALGQ